MSEWQREHTVNTDQGSVAWTDTRFDDGKKV